MNWDAETQINLVYEELNKLGVEMGEAHRTEREKTIATWQGDKPAWKSVVRRAGRSVKLIVMRVGDPFGIKKWHWLNEGTRERYMHVSEDWQSKTKVGWVGSGKGQGHTIGLGRPLPGIKARNWNKIINKKLIKRMAARIPTSIRKGLKKRRPGKHAGKRFIYG
jgi:hypothetical protein